MHKEIISVATLPPENSIGNANLENMVLFSLSNPKSSLTRKKDKNMLETMEIINPRFFTSVRCC